MAAALRFCPSPHQQCENWHHQLLKFHLIFLGRDTDYSYCCAQHLNRAILTNHHLRKWLPTIPKFSSPFPRLVGVILISLCVSLPFPASTSVCQVNVHFLTQTIPIHLSFPLPIMFLLHAVPSALNPFSFSSLFPFSFFFHLSPNHVISFHLDLEKLWVWNLT